MAPFFSVGCFGKLPIHADFIRYGAEAPEVRGLDQWFQEGILFAKSKLGRSWEEDFPKACPWKFVFHTRDSDRFLAGVYIPSRDKGGRRYPFFLFLRVERGRFGLPLALAPLFFSAPLAEFLRTAEAGGEEKDLRSFLARLEGMAMSIPARTGTDFDSVKEAYRRRLESRTAPEFWKDLLGDFGRPEKYLIAQNLVEILRPLRRQGLDRFGLGLKFPLPKNRGIDYDIPFWFDLSFRLLRQEKVDPIFFWNEKPSPERPCMIAFLNDPSPKSFLFQVRPDLKGDWLYDLASDGPFGLEEARDKVPAGLKEILERDPLPLAGFLETFEGFE